MSDVVYGLWQQQERMDLIAKSVMIRGALAFILTAICFAMFHTVWLAACGMALAWAIVFAVFDVHHGTAVAHELGQGFMPRFSGARMRTLARLSLPLGIVTMLNSFNANVPRYMISHFRTVRELGIFSALLYIFTAGTMVVGALGQSAMPRLALYVSQGKARDFRRLANRLLLIGMMMGTSGILAAVAFGREIVTVIYGHEYAQDSRVFTWLMFAAAFGYMVSFAGYSLTATRAFNIQMPLCCFVTAITLVSCYVMIRAGGAAGAAKALVVVGLIQLIATMAVLRYSETRRLAALQ
jgi:O-antigen/teichoic acid export membrane protein